MKKVRHKHNKKRNTAFLYEVLVKELTKAIVEKQSKRKVEIAKTLKKYFNKILPPALDAPPVSHNSPGSLWLYKPYLKSS